jgi:hypothetical protein
LVERSTAVFVSGLSEKEFEMVNAVCAEPSQDELREAISLDDVVTFGDVYHANVVLRHVRNDLQMAEKLVAADEEIARPLLQWARCDVSVAVAILRAVAPLRAAICFGE